VIPLPVIFAIVSAVAGATGAHLYTRNHYETILAERTAAHATALAQANADALAKTLSLQAAKDKALKAAAVRQSALARDLAANRDGLVRLSHAADSALRSAHDSHEQCIARATAFSDVFAGCGKQLVDLGATADRLASDKQALIESWPTSR
jgi:hypothetical protein